MYVAKKAWVNDPKPIDCPTPPRSALPYGAPPEEVLGCGWVEALLSSTISRWILRSMGSPGLSSCPPRGPTQRAVGRLASSPFSRLGPIGQRFCSRSPFIREGNFGFLGYSCLIVIRQQTRLWVNGCAGPAFGMSELHRESCVYKS